MVQGVTISIKDELVSKPYVDMTIKLMQKFGVTVEQLDGLQKLHIPGQQTYKSPGTVFVEGDASSASYFLAGATITGGKIRVVGCGSESVQVRCCTACQCGAEPHRAPRSRPFSAVQGDVRFAEVMELMGATVEYEPNAMVLTGPSGKLKAIDHNCNDIPDAAMTAAVAALFADGCATPPMWVAHVHTSADMRSTCTTIGRYMSRVSERARQCIAAARSRSGSHFDHVAR